MVPPHYKGELVFSTAPYVTQNDFASLTVSNLNYAEFEDCYHLGCDAMLLFYPEDVGRSSCLQNISSDLPDPVLHPRRQQSS
jgi:hypothetical protein